MLHHRNIHCPLVARRIACISCNYPPSEALYVDELQYLEGRIIQLEETVEQVKERCEKYIEREQNNRGVRKGSKGVGIVRSVCTGCYSKPCICASL